MKEPEFQLTPPADERAERLRHLPGGEVTPADQFARLGIDVLDEIAGFCEAPNVLHVGAAVVDEDVAALVGMHHQLLTIFIEHQELAGRAVEVPGVVRQFLMIEFQLASIDIETDHRTGVKIVAGARALRLEVAARPIVERRRVRCAPPDRVGLRIVGARHPAAAAAGAPGIVAPGLHRVVCARDRLELPFLFPGRRIDAEDWAAARPFASLRADDDGALGVKRGACEADRQLLRILAIWSPTPACPSSCRAQTGARPWCRRTPCLRRSRLRDCKASEVWRRISASSKSGI